MTSMGVRLGRYGVAGWLALGLAAACGGSDPTSPPVKVCTPGQTISCACGGGVEGAQTCDTDGAAYGACQCGAGGAGGKGAAGTGGGAAGTGTAGKGASGGGTAGSGAGGSGTAGNGTAGGGTAGSGVAGSGTAGSGVAGSGVAGSGTAGSGVAGSGVAGSGIAGSGIAGSGTAGSGVAGSGVAGSGTAGSGVAGSGVAGNGTAGNGTGGTGFAGSGTGGTGFAGSGIAGSGGSTATGGAAGSGGSAPDPCAGRVPDATAPTGSVSNASGTWTNTQGANVMLDVSTLVDGYAVNGFNVGGTKIHLTDFVKSCGYWQAGTEKIGGRDLQIYIYSPIPPVLGTANAHLVGTEQPAAPGSASGQCTLSDVGDGMSITGTLDITATDTTHIAGTFSFPGPGIMGTFDVPICNPNASLSPKVCCVP